MNKQLLKKINKGTNLSLALLLVITPPLLAHVWDMENKLAPIMLKFELSMIIIESGCDLEIIEACQVLETEKENIEKIRSYEFKLFDYESYKVKKIHEAFERVHQSKENKEMFDVLLTKL